MDKLSEDVLRKLYSRFEMEDEVTVSSSEFEQTQTDLLIQKGLINKLDASTISD